MRRSVLDGLGGAHAAGPWIGLSTILPQDRWRPWATRWPSTLLAKTRPQRERKWLRWGRRIGMASLSNAGVACARSASPAPRGDPLWHCVHAAASDHADTITITSPRTPYRRPCCPCSPPTRRRPRSAYVDIEVVCAPDRDALFADYGLEPAHTLLKIDVQGFESVNWAEQRSLKQLGGVQPSLLSFPSTTIGYSCQSSSSARISKG